MNVAGKTCGDDALVFVFGKQLAQHHADALFRGCRTTLFGVGAVEHQQANAVSCSKRTQASQVGASIVHWSEVDLEVARMNNDALRCVQCNGMCVRNRVGDGNELHIEWPNASTLVVDNGDQLGFAKQPRFFNAMARQTKRDF